MKHFLCLWRGWRSLPGPPQQASLGFIKRRLEDGNWSGWRVAERMIVWQRPALLTCPPRAPIRKRSHPPQGLEAAKHITGVRRCQLPRGTARWDFHSTCQPSRPDFITCTCEFEVTRLYCQHWKSVTQRGNRVVVIAPRQTWNDAPGNIFWLGNTHTHTHTHTEQLVNLQPIRPVWVSKRFVRVPPPQCAPMCLFSLLITALFT